MVKANAEDSGVYAMKDDDRDGGTPTPGPTPVPEPLVDPPGRGDGDDEE